ncbi:MAG TPA: peptidylprolyl isomerase [Candidatus Acidoferrales bacterium]|nr:peptidylprolyl isomerase [Candidatus Acidoferrales bacterium]
MIRMAMILLLAFGAAIPREQSANPASNVEAPKEQSSSGTKTPGDAGRLRQQPVSSAPKPTDGAASVAPAAAVMTVHGACETPSPASGGGNEDSCTTVLTREQFDTLVNSLNTGNQPLAPAMRLKLAQAYADLLAFATAAEKAGIKNTAGFQEVMRLVRTRTLAELFQRSLVEKFRNPPPAEIEDYYNKNLAKFEEIKLQRIFVPRTNPKAADQADFEKRAQQTASDLRERLAKGEDPSVLQKEAYTALGVEGNPPSIDFGNRRRGAQSSEQDQELFSLPTGGTSKVEPIPGGFLIYRVESRQTLALDKVKDEIAREMFRRKMEEESRRIKAEVHADYNEAYFGPVSVTPQAPPQSPPPPKE